MKVFIIDIGNDGAYEDYYSQISHVSSSYRKASQWLLDLGYKPYPIRCYKTKEKVLRFTLINNSEDDDTYTAEIIEMELDKV